MKLDLVTIGGAVVVHVGVGSVEVAVANAGAVVVKIVAVIIRIVVAAAAGRTERLSQRMVKRPSSLYAEMAVFLSPAKELPGILSLEVGKLSD
jgi:hypothetical protein